MEKKASLQEIIESYALGKNTLKWVSKGGDILKHIGGNMILIKFTKEDGDTSWTTETLSAHIVSIRDFDPLTGTYQIVYNETPDGELKEQRIIPEGFSFNNPEKDNWMHRFIPMSLHLLLTEAEIHYDRLKKLFDTRPGLPMDKIRELQNGKQEDSLGYHNYISAVIDSDVPGGLGMGIISFRINEITRPQSLSKAVHFGIKDEAGNFFGVKMLDDAVDGAIEGFNVNGTLVGTLKIMDLQDDMPTETKEEKDGTDANQ